MEQKLFRIAKAEIKPSKSNPDQKFISALVVEDTSEREAKLAQLLGKKAPKLLGASKAYRTAFLDYNPNYDAVKAWMEEDVATREPIALYGTNPTKETALPFYVKDADGNYRTDDKGKKLMSQSVTFFCPDGDSEITIFRRICDGLEFAEVSAEPVNQDPLDVQ